MRRHTLEKWLGEPFFERTLVGSLVRVAIKRAYILAEVIQAQEREPGTYRRAFGVACQPLAGVGSRPLPCGGGVLPASPVVSFVDSAALSCQRSCIFWGRGRI